MGQPAASTLGMSTEPVKIKDRLALARHKRRTWQPGPTGGLEEDHVIIAANQAALMCSGTEELARAASRSR